MIKGYYSIDGAAVVRLRVAINFDITDVWARGLRDSTSLEARAFGSAGLYYSVRDCRIKKGQRYYTYQIDVLNANSVVFYTVLLDMHGYCQVDIRYGAQRTNNRLNTGYRELFDYLRFVVLEEKICRADLALTVNLPISFVVKHIKEGSYKSLLSRKNMVMYGDVNSPNSVRLGSPDTVEVAIYDKYRELFANANKLSYNDKLEDYFENFGDTENVTRIEFRLSRNYLRNVDIDTPDDFNKALFDLWSTMLLKYFLPTKAPYDGHNDQDTAEWWLQLPAIGQKLNVKQRPIMFNRVLLSREWFCKYRTLMNRTEGYIASMVASLARDKNHVDKALQVIFRRLLKEGDSIRERSLSRFALC